MSDYRVRVAKDYTVFAAAHFITFNRNICERIHGHNYRVRVTVEGPLDENAYVVDFIALRDGLKKIILELDHHVLLPTQHPMIHVAEENGEIVARFEGRRWVFPIDDCVLMDLRGFNRHRAGCVFEIQCLAHSMPASRVVFLVDRVTDRGFVEETWAAAACSPISAPPWAT